MIVTIFEVIALICFILATAKFPSPDRFNIGWLGLAFWMLALLLTGIK